MTLLRIALYRSLSAGLAVLAAFSAHGQSLSEFVGKMKWNSDQQGPLICVAGDHQSWSRSEPNDNSPIGLVDYHRRSQKVGHLTALVSPRRLELPDASSENPYDSLTKSEKLTVFLGSLNAEQWRDLSEKGISPRQLSGWQRQLLEAIIPHPFRGREWTFDGKGGSGTGETPSDLAKEILPDLRLQVFKVLGFEFASYKGKDNNTLNLGTSSALYRPAGTHVYRLEGNDEEQERAAFSGQWVDNTEKPSQLNAQSPALAKMIRLDGIKSISDLLQRISQECGIEIVADRRVAASSVSFVGDQAAASDLLRAAAISLGGAYRRVGSAYVLTYDVLGLATRSIRIQANGALTRLDIQPKLLAARHELSPTQLLARLDFLEDDAFHARSYMRTSGLKPGDDGVYGWLPLSALNGPMQAAYPSSVPNTYQSGPDTLNQDPLSVGKVRFNVTMGMRFLLPNGTPVEWPNVDLFTGSMGVTGSKVVPLELPTDPSKYPPGFFAGYRTDDPAAVKEFCHRAKDHGMKEVWVETSQAEVLRAAEESGLGVDWVVRPWSAFKSEGQNLDLNVLGQSGSQLNAIPETRINYQRKQTRFFQSSLSPWNSGLVDHWNRLVAIAGDKQVRKIIVADSMLPGYEGPSGHDTERPSPLSTTYNGVEMMKSLSDFLPDVFRFGYGTPARLACIRQLGFDPIDYPNPFRAINFPPIPYFQQTEGYEFPNWPIDASGDLKSFVDFEKLNHDKEFEATSELIKRLEATGHPILLQYPALNGDLQAPPAEYGPSSLLEDTYNWGRDSIEAITVNPLTVEDSNGTLAFEYFFKLSKPTCVDFSDVPVSKLGLYFDRVFKMRPSR